MKKLFLLLVTTCGVALFASCESTEAVTRNVISFNGNDYNITKADLCDDFNFRDSLFRFTPKPDDGDAYEPYGRMYVLALSTQGITIEDTEDSTEDQYVIPQIEGVKYAHLYLMFLSSGFNGICEGIYKVPEQETLSVVKMGVRDVWTGTPGPMAIGALYSDVLPQPAKLMGGTIEVKRGLLAYDIILKDVKIKVLSKKVKPGFPPVPVDAGFSIEGRYTGLVVKNSVPIIPPLFGLRTK